MATVTKIKEKKASKDSAKRIKTTAKTKAVKGRTKSSKKATPKVKAVSKAKAPKKNVKKSTKKVAPAKANMAKKTKAATKRKANATTKRKSKTTKKRKNKKAAEPAEESGEGEPETIENELEEKLPRNRLRWMQGQKK